jgi:hypothetical protein
MEQDLNKLPNINLIITLSNKLDQENNKMTEELTGPTEIIRIVTTTAINLSNDPTIINRTTIKSMHYFRHPTRRSIADCLQQTDDNLIPEMIPTNSDLNESTVPRAE